MALQSERHAPQDASLALCVLIPIATYAISSPLSSFKQITLIPTLACAPALSWLPSCVHMLFFMGSTVPCMAASYNSISLEVRPNPPGAPWILSPPTRPPNSLASSSYHFSGPEFCYLLLSSVLWNLPVL